MDILIFVVLELEECKTCERKGGVCRRDFDARVDKETSERILVPSTTSCDIEITGESSLGVILGKLLYFYIC